MDLISSLYPVLSERRPYPTLYLPASFFLTLVPFLTSNRLLGVSATFPILLLLCIWAPFYTFGSPSADYYNSGPFMAMLLWYLEFAVFTPPDGPDAPVFIGSASVIAAQSKSKAKTLADISSRLQKLRWAFRLMIPPNRGIGWNWQVKSVPSDPNAMLPKWSYVRTHLQNVLVTYLRSVAMLIIMGFASTMENEWNVNQDWQSVVLNAVVGWSGAIWVWDRLGCFYSLAAALSVTIKLCETWEWPPLMGPLSDAWSVRQMWSVTYHQVMRRMLQQPSIRISRLLHFRKGTVGSKYTQLFISFAISFAFHRFQMFNVTRKDSGEFAFFMLQPVAITIEDLISWIFCKCFGSNKSNAGVRYQKILGYAWVFFWFSFCLSLYIKGLRDADIIRDALFENRPFELGFSLGEGLRTSLKAPDSSIG